MDCKQKRMGIVGCFGQIENIKRQSLNKAMIAEQSQNCVICHFLFSTIGLNNGGC